LIDLQSQENVKSVLLQVINLINKVEHISKKESPIDYFVKVLVLIQ